jgi:hypothetical protein
MAEIGPDTDISASVGRKGVNRPDDIARVKGFLNAILAEEGGADGTLDESDTASFGTDFEALVKAIVIFQDKNFKGWFPPDGLVERRRNTHKALVNKSRRAHLLIEKEAATFVPATGYVLDTDHFGYSRAGLKQDHPMLATDWTTRDPTLPPIQMVPVSGQRTLGIYGSITGSTWTFEIAGTNPDAVWIMNTTDRSVTIVGARKGEAEVRANGYLPGVATATLRVRPHVTVTVNTVHIGRPRTPGAEDNFARLIPAISRLYEGQTNITFTVGSIRVLDKLNGVDVDPNKPITDISPTGMNTHQARTTWRIEQPFNLHEMGPEFPAQGDTVLTVFFSDRIERFQDRGVAGHGERVGGRLAWFRIGSAVRSAASEFVVPAHEIGHLLGFRHITAPRSETYLMAEAFGNNNMRIPSDTLVQLRV